MKWDHSSVQITAGGVHRAVVYYRDSPGREVTLLRGVPIKGLRYSSADPFGDAVASFETSALNVLSDLTVPDARWCGKDTLVDIFWCPLINKPDDWPDPAPSEDMQPVVDPRTGRADKIAPLRVPAKAKGRWRPTAKLSGYAVFEGFIADRGPGDTSMSVQCQGTLFQADLLNAKPYYPPRPRTLESLIGECFSHATEPSLRMQPMVIRWPAHWAVRGPASTRDDTLYRPNVKPGALWTGYTTRQTGSWDKKLTGFIQNLLSYMIVKPGSGRGVVPGNQWTLLTARRSPSNATGRTPVLQVRDRFRPPDVSVWAGSRGVATALQSDSTQSSNADYGSGTDLAGTAWQNSYVSPRGERTDYLPLAANRAVYPHVHNPNFDRYRFKRESYATYGAGLSQLDAAESAKANQARNFDEGYAGTVTLSVDPPEINRWLIQAGWTLKLKGFLGTGEDGINLHIAQVEADVDGGTVTLTVDSRYRDLLTIREAMIRARDALTPSKLLQLNRNSAVIEDIQARWNYSAGSGFIPLSSRRMQYNKPATSIFPSRAWLKAHPPRTHASAYVKCRASSKSSLKRWAGPYRILMAQRGTIRRTEIACVDRNGNVLRIPFHVSFYYNNGIEARMMPHAAGVYSPFISNAFQSIDPATGEPFRVPGREPDQSLVIGFGNKEQPAGYWPGIYRPKVKPTGLLVEEGPWQFDCSSNNPNYDHLAAPGSITSSQAVGIAGQGRMSAVRGHPETISIYAMFYAQHTEPVYFIGRLFRQEPGTSE